MSGQRRPRAEAEPFARELLDGTKGADEVIIGGSWRRGCSMIGDVDVLVVTATGTLDGVAMPAAFARREGGPRVMHGTVTLGGASIGADVWACTREERGAALMFVTGPQQLNVRQRIRAQRAGCKLSQYGLWRDGSLVAGLESEEGVYAALGWPWVPPLERDAAAGLR